jgi:hypothetical protein
MGPEQLNNVVNNYLLNYYIKEEQKKKNEIKAVAINSETLPERKEESLT